MNNIAMTNMVVLKQPREGQVKSEYVDHIAATPKSQKLESTRISKAKKSCPNSLVTELLTKRIAAIPSLFPSLPKNNDIKHSMIAAVCRYERGGVSPPSQKEHIQLDEKSDGVCNIAKPMRYQGEKLLLSGWQEVTSIQADCSDTKESIPIKMRNDRSL